MNELKRIGRIINLPSLRRAVENGENPVIRPEDILKVERKFGVSGVLTIFDYLNRYRKTSSPQSEEYQEFGS